MGLDLYFNAFLDLDTERNHHTGFSYIPFNSIVSYAKLYDFDEEQTEDLIYLIKQMDSAHIAKLQKKKDAKTKKPIQKRKR